MLLGSKAAGTIQFDYFDHMRCLTWFGEVINISIVIEAIIITFLLHMEYRIRNVRTKLLVWLVLPIHGLIFPEMQQSPPSTTCHA